MTETQPDHTATIAAMIADIESNAVRTSQQNRDHAILTILADIAQRQEDLESQHKAHRMEVDAIEKHTMGEAYDRIAALESWRETQTGDGR